MNITQAKTILGRKFRGASLDDVQGILDFTVFEEAGKNLLAEIDPYETVRTGEVNLFNEVYDYGLTSPAPDLKGKKVLDIRPQANRTQADDVHQTFTEEFDRDKNFKTNEFSVQFDEGVKFIRINRSIPHSITVTSLTVGDYTAGTGVSNIASDTILFARDGSSIRFDVSNGTNLLTWDGAAVDLDDHELKSSLFLIVYVPDSTLFTSITLRIGSSSVDYYEISGTIQFGTVRTGFNLFRFDWDGQTEVGTVVETAIDFVRYAIVMSAADTDIRISKLFSKLPSPHEFLYYSEALFRPETGTTWKTLPTADTDIINLEADAENIFIYECCVLISEDLQREEETVKFMRKLGRKPDGTMTGVGLYGDYKTDKPSEAIRPNQQWYTTPRSSRQTFRVRRA